jgi:hypothetical protein
VKGNFYSKGGNLRRKKGKHNKGRLKRKVDKRKEGGKKWQAGPCDMRLKKERRGKEGVGRIKQCETDVRRERKLRMVTGRKSTKNTNIEGREKEC